MPDAAPSQSNLKFLRQLLDDAWKRSRQMPVLGAAYVLGLIALFVLVLLVVAQGLAPRVLIGVVAALALLAVVTLLAKAADQQEKAPWKEALMWVCTVVISAVLGLGVYWLYLVIRASAPGQPIATSVTTIPSSSPPPRAGVEATPAASESASAPTSDAEAAMARHDHLLALDSVLRKDAENWDTLRSKVEELGRVSEPDSADDGRTTYRILWQLDNPLADDLSHHFEAYSDERTKLLDRAQKQDRGVRELRSQIRKQLPADLDDEGDRDRVAEGITRRCLGKQFPAYVKVEGNTMFQTFGGGGGSGPVLEEEVRRLRKAIAVLDGAKPSGALLDSCEAYAAGARKLAADATFLKTSSLSLAEMRTLKGDCLFLKSN